jgi:threonyl-tRNA synthetase
MVNIRKYGEQDTASAPLEEFVLALKEEIKERRALTR